LDHLRAELEIRGLWKCAKQLPKLDKKCYGKVAEIVRRCREGDCFLPPQKVAAEFAGVTLREGIGTATLILSAVAVVQGVALAVLFAQLSSLIAQNAELQRRYDLLALDLANLRDEVMKLKKTFSNDFNSIKDTLEAIKYVLYVLGR